MSHKHKKQVQIIYYKTPQYAINFIVSQVFMLKGSMPAVGALQISWLAS